MDGHCFPLHEELERARLCWHNDEVWRRILNFEQKRCSLLFPIVLALKNNTLPSFQKNNIIFNVKKKKTIKKGACILNSKDCLGSRIPILDIIGKLHKSLDNFLPYLPLRHVGSSAYARWQTKHRWRSAMQKAAQGHLQFLIVSLTDFSMLRYSQRCTSAASQSTQPQKANSVIIYFSSISDNITLCKQKLHHMLKKKA